MKKYLLFSFMFLFLFCGCITAPIKEIPKNLYENYDVNSLKDTDKTFQLSDVTDIQVNDNGDSKLIRFTNDWYLVHKDWIRTFNENQDELINLLDQKKSQRIENWENKKKIIKNVVWCSIIAIILLIIGVKLYNKFKHG